MSEFTQGYKYHINMLLTAFGGAESGSQIITEKLKKDLVIWKNDLRVARKGMLIARPPFGPPVTALSFVSDTAGAAYRWWIGMRVNSSKPGDREVTAVSFEGKRMTFGAEYRWPFSLLVQDKDGEGREFGLKSATLEAVGLVLPAVTGPELVRGRLGKLGVNNLSLV